MEDSYRRLDDRRPTLPSLFSKRPRSDFDVSIGRDLPSYFGRDDERAANRFIGDSDSVGASYDRYTHSAQISLYGGGGSTRPLSGGLSGHPIDDPRMIGIGGSNPVVTTKGHSMGLGGGRPLPPDASSTLFVEGLPANCTRREASHIFRPFVGYKEVRLVTKERRRSGDDPLVLCFVDFVSPAHAATTMDALQGGAFCEHFTLVSVIVYESTAWWLIGTITNHHDTSLLPSLTVSGQALWTMFSMMPLFMACPFWWS